ncbi:hypothetical protein ACFQX6_02605 [Streptosporangium lutulentum]
MAEPQAAADVQIGDLGAYQDAVRLVLTSDLITVVHPGPGCWTGYCPGPTSSPGISASCSATP